MTGRMFEFITEKPINLLGGECPYGCVYCWTKDLIKRFNMKKYKGALTIDEKQWKRDNFKDGDFIFLNDMLDFSAASPETITVLFKWISYRSQAKFLLLTKNPKIYLDYLHILPANAVLGATIESDIDYPLLSKAPSQNDRWYWMTHLASAVREGKRFRKNPLFISIEPILDFSKHLELMLYLIKPWAVAIGRDNYHNNLPEPSKDKIEGLIASLEKDGIKVYRKTI